MKTYKFTNTHAFLSTLDAAPVISGERLVPAAFLGVLVLSL